jgi:hypothetical protein
VSKTRGGGPVRIQDVDSVDGIDGVEVGLPSALPMMHEERTRRVGRGSYPYNTTTSGKLPSNCSGKEKQKHRNCRQTQSLGMS